MDKVREKIQEGFEKASEEAGQELGFPLSDLLNLPTGEVTIALLQPAGRDLAGVALMEIGDQQETLDKALAKLDTVVLGVSPDPVPRLGRFIEKEGLNFTLLSDEDHAVAEKYGAWGLKKFMGREFMGVLRTTFVIGKDGRVKHVMDKVKTKSHHDDVIAIIQQLGL